MGIQEVTSNLIEVFNRPICGYAGRYVVPASTTTAFDEGLTRCPQALSSGKSCPTFKILNEAFKSR